LIILLVFLVIFAIQNTQPVAVEILFWEISASAALSIRVSFLIGFLTGWLVGVVKPGGKKIQFSFSFLSRRIWARLEIRSAAQW
jgi:uncharacterized integral membrane protein